MKISVIITTFNSEKNVGRAIKSVTGCDEIIVVDSFSTDNKISIVEKYEAEIHYRAYVGSLRQLQKCFSLLKDIRMVSRGLYSYHFLLFINLRLT